MPSRNLTMKKKISTAVVIFLLFFLKLSLASEFFLNGKDWKKLDALSCSSDEKRCIKIALLKIIYESAFFNGKTMFPIDDKKGNFLQQYAEDFYHCSLIVDRLYTKEANIPIPIFFTLQMAAMTKAGLLDSLVEEYKNSIEHTLKAQKLIE